MFKFDEDDPLWLLPKYFPAPTSHDIEVGMAIADSMGAEHVDIEEELAELRQRASARMDRARDIWENILHESATDVEACEAFRKAGLLDEAYHDAEILRTLEFIQMTQRRRN
jgi:hypothetical protein